MPKKSNKSKSIYQKLSFLDSKDKKIMLGLVVIFTLMVFFRIGNLKAPQTMYTTKQDNRDIIIDFGNYIDVGSLDIYLGNLDNRHLAISTFNEVSGVWEVINSEAVASSVFQWNKIDINYNLRYLGIVATDDEGDFLEFVFKSPSGQVLMPANAGNYPELFDEQNLYYKTAEKTYMDGTMFDEIYHGRTGYEFVHSLPTYETTHPHLGKCIIALGIKLFGMTPFGMRFFVAIFGILFIPLMYAFAKYLFKDTFVATCVGVFITFDCMHYTLSRIATIDIFVAFFIVACYYYMYRYITEDSLYRQTSTASTDKFMPKSIYILLALSGIFMGFAVATKLTGVYAGVGLAVIFIFHTIRHFPKGQVLRLFGFCVLFFIVIPLFSYFLAYIPSVELYAQMGSTDKTVTFDKENGLTIGYGYTGLIAKTLRNTNYMINYHKNLVAEHYYSSPFYEWPIIWMPLLAANDNVNTARVVSAVSYMGNPLIWWTGIPCVLFTAFYAVFKKDKKAAFLTVSYLAQYVPWMLVPRITFIYHYLPGILFTMLMMGFTVDKLIKWKSSLRRVINIYLVLVVLVFIIYFPVISGLPVSKEFGYTLRLLPDWILVL